MLDQGMKQLAFEMIEHSDAVCVRLQGVLDEHNNLSEVAEAIFEESEKVGSSLIIADLGEIKRINSCGVRDWTAWVEAVEKRGHDFVFVHCSPAIVSQVRMVEAFLGEGKATSFFLEFYCPQCDSEQIREVDVVSATRRAEQGAPEEACESCGQTLEVDEFEGSFDSLLERFQRPQAPEHVRALRGYLGDGALRDEPEFAKSAEGQDVGDAPASLPSENPACAAADDEAPVAEAQGESRSGQRVARPEAPQAQAARSSGAERALKERPLLYAALGGLVVLVVVLAVSLLGQ